MDSGQILAITAAIDLRWLIEKITLDRSPHCIKKGDAALNRTWGSAWSRISETESRTAIFIG